MRSFSCHSVTFKLYYIILIIFTGGYTVSSEYQCKEFEKDISETVTTLTKLLVSLKSSYDRINVDGLSAIQMGAGIISKGIVDIQSFRNYSSLDFAKILKDMLKRIEDITLSALPVIKKKTPSYFRQFKKVVSYPLIFSNSYRQLGDCPSWTQKSTLKRPLKSHYNESFGDNCLSNAMGTVTSNSRCESTKRCWRYMIKSSARKIGYELTHGVIYLLFLRQFGCEAAVGANFQSLLHNFCCQIKAEFNKVLEQDFWVNYQTVDILCEQAIVCSAAGYEDFTDDRLFQVLKNEQSKLGCFGPLKGRPKVGRRLLYDSPLLGGCSSHESGLASAFLSIRLTHLIKSFRSVCSR